MAPESTTAGEVDEEEDSLFGSPPPSPGRSQAGRSPSPALALPSRVNGMSSATQNVGTIALPGSHPYSELPVNPLALSLSHPTAPRPPAQGVNPPYWAQQQAVPACPPSVASSPRSQSAAPPTRPRKKTVKSKSKESTPRLPGPEIPLPDPSVPPPANFLRNQSALLGTAGLVGGVKPAKLSTHRQNRGTTASNPIVVEDEEETPVIGRSRFRHPYIKPIDPSLLPAPTNQEIVAMLIGQKDIFPVLENILKLIAAGSSAPAPSQQQQQQQQQARASSSNNSRSSSAAPPLKKRKLNRVPAGATDWDVPYPFAQGEGPDAYRTTWERERGKQLISQLVNLIKTAARKAATKNYLRDEEVRRKMMEEQWRTREDEARKQEELRVSAAGEKRVRGYYRPATAVYGLEGEEARVAIEEMHEVLADNSNGMWESRLSLSEPTPPLPIPPSNTNTPTSMASSQSQPSTPFDQLISSLLAASPQQGLPSTNVPSANTSVLFAPNYQTPVNPVPSTPSTSITSSTQSSEGVDQALFDSWMNVLQSFPVPSEGFTQAQSLDAQTPSAMSAASPSASDTFGFFDDGGFDFGSMGMDFGDTSTGGSLPEFDALMASFPQQPDVDSNGMDIDSTGTPKQLPMDHLIDPQLLSISIPQPLHPANISGSSNSSTQPPSLAPSPIPSTSSFGGNHDPLTPTSATWDISLPDVFTGTENTMQGGSIEARQGTLWSNFWNFGDDTQWRNGNLDGEHDDQVSAMLTVFDNIPKDTKGKRREVLPVETVPEYQPQLEQAEPSPPPPPLSPATTSTSRPSESRTTPISSASLLSAPPMSVALNVKKNSPLVKADILKRARERRLQILEELQRVKIQLWETTIEQGALTHLVKFYNDIETAKV